VTSGRVVIVGGGIAGLAAALELARRGTPYLLLEATDRLGGVIRTESRDGYLIEGGPDSILAQKPDGIALCQELGLGPELLPTNPSQRAVYVLWNGRLVPVPPGMMLAAPSRILPILRSPLFSFGGKLRMAAELGIPPRRKSEDESIASFLRRRFGRELLDRLGEPLLAGIHAGDAERLSMRSTFPRLVELEARYGSVARGLRRALPPARKEAPAWPSAFASLRGGLGMLVDALERTLGEACLRRGSSAAAIESTPDGPAVRTTAGESFPGRAVLLALPAHKSAPLLDALAPDAARGLRAIRFASTAAVVLGFRREDVEHPLDGYGFIVPRSAGLHVTACSFYSTKFPGRVPEGRVALRAFLGGIHDEGVLHLDDGALVALACKELKAPLGLRAEPELARVFRWPAGTPQMEIGHASRLAAIDAALARVPSLHLTGAGLRGTGLPDTIADARRVAAAAAG
jgi:protoporphyrinogen/coproporphyrinogen III oxidase